MHQRKLDDKSDEYKKRADLLVEHEVSHYGEFSINLKRFSADNATNVWLRHFNRSPPYTCYSGHTVHAR